MSDRLSDFERLALLRERGAIDEDEYAAEKARLLDDPPARPRARWLWPAAALALLVTVVAVAAALSWNIVPRAKPVDPPSPRASARPTPTIQGVAALLPNERLAAAIRAAFPRGASAEGRDGEHYVFDTHRLVDAPFGPVLVSEGRVSDAAHVNAGRLDVTYLTPEGDHYATGPRFPAAVVAGTFGQMSEWAVSPKFGRLPVIYAEGGGTWQGYTCGWTTLAALTPTGPVELASFMDSYDDSGAVQENAQSTEGRIADIVPDRSFTVRFTGTRRFDAHYCRQGSRYVLQVGDANTLQGC